MLFHYTSLQGLIGVLNAQSLWASHCEFLNDSQEYFEAIDYLKQQTSALWMNDDYLSPIAWGMRGILEELKDSEIYTTSFSEKADLLSQWRGYCDSGIGVCIGFNKKIIQDFCNKNSYELEKCLYENEEKKNLLRDLIEKCILDLPRPKLTRSEFYSADSKVRVDHEFSYRESLTADNMHSKNALLNFKEKANELAPRIKNIGFIEEAEWRIIVRNPLQKINFRASKTYLIPYIDLPIIKNNVIETIIIGPNPHPQRCIKSIEKLLNNCGLGHVKVSQSKIPFNSW